MQEGSRTRTKERKERKEKSKRKKVPVPTSLHDNTAPILERFVWGVNKLDEESGLRCNCLPAKNDENACCTYVSDFRLSRISSFSKMLLVLTSGLPESSTIGFDLDLVSEGVGDEDLEEDLGVWDPSGGGVRRLLFRGGKSECVERGVGDDNLFLVFWALLVAIVGVFGVFAPYEGVFGNGCCSSLVVSDLNIHLKVSTRGFDFERCMRVEGCSDDDAVVDSLARCKLIGGI